MGGLLTLSAAASKGGSHRVIHLSRIAVERNDFHFGGEMAQCPLCGEEGVQSQGFVGGRDMSAYECPTCGRFGLDGLIAMDIPTKAADERYLLSAVIRRAADAGQFTEITDENYSALLASAPRWESLFEGIDRLMLLLAGRAPHFLTQVKYDKKHDYPLIAAKGEAGMNELLVIAHQLGLIDERTRRITVEGWKRIDALRATQPKARRAFVAMWFDPQMEEAWINGLKPGVDDTKYYVADRVNSEEHNDRIDFRIVAMIRRSGLVVADFTGDRGGVYFEAGLAVGLDIPVIWTCRRDWFSKLHFDTNHYNHIVWDTPEDLRDQLTLRLNATVVPRAAL